MYKKYGWLVYNGCLMTPKFIEIHNWYKKTAEENNIRLDLVKNNDILINIQEGSASVRGNIPETMPDFVLFLDKDIRLAKHLEKCGLRLFNSAFSIEACDDKTLTHELLANHNIKMPKTIIAPLVFSNTEETGSCYCEMLEDELSYPIVIKEAFGSFGQQVYIADNREELIKIRKKLVHIPHLYQEFIKSSRGKDIRLHVVGHEVVTSMLRCNDSDFRANITNGGTAYRTDPPKEFKDMAVKASNLLGSDFSGVDLLFGPDDEPILCEVNSNAHIKNVYMCTGVDVSLYIFSHIEKQLG